MPFPEPKFSPIWANYIPKERKFPVVFNLGMRKRDFALDPARGRLTSQSAL